MGVGRTDFSEGRLRKWLDMRNARARCANRASLERTMSIKFVVEASPVLTGIASARLCWRLPKLAESLVALAARMPHLTLTGSAWSRVVRRVHMS